MTNRVQTLRSSVSGNLPAAGTRQPGELWVNFADFALGFIDSSQTAQKVLGVRLFVTSANYAIGDFVVQGGNLYRAIAASAPGAFVSANWSKVGTAQDLAQYLPLAGGTLTGPLILAADPTVALGATTKQYADKMLPLAGGTMTGPLVLPANPTAPLQPATKQYVDALPLSYNDNRLDNADMWIDQHNAGASIAVPAGALFCPDRWTIAASKAHVTVGQNYNGSPVCPGFQYYLGAQVTSAWGTIAAGDYAQIWQTIEADRVGDFMWGTVNAQPVTLSFWVRSSLTGNFSAVIQSGSSTAIRNYVFTYSIPTANTWTKIVQTIPGDTAGTWVMSGNAGGMSVCFDLGSGSTYRTSTLNAWINGGTTGFIGATGAVSLIGTNGAKFALTGVKLEIGSIATPFNRQSLAKTLADCQRYFQLVTASIQMSVSGVVTISSGVQWPTMRAMPTAVDFAGGLRNNVTAPTFRVSTTYGGSMQFNTVGAGDTYILGEVFSLSAEL